MKYVSLLLLIIIGLLSCKNKNLIYWSSVTFDTNILQSPVYKKLDQEKEYNNRFNLDSSRKLKSSDVIYKGSKKYNCYAYFDHQDTLKISIGHNPGIDSWSGFEIRYCGDKFHTEIISDGMHMPSDDECQPQILYQDLILDKHRYTVGDSLFGKIEFNIKTKCSETISSGVGYFRTKIH
jgi:hypothetical protein